MNSSLFSTAAELRSRWRKVKEVGTATVRWIRVVAVFGTGVNVGSSPGGTVNLAAGRLARCG